MLCSGWSHPFLVVALASSLLAAAPGERDARALCEDYRYADAIAAVRAMPAPPPEARRWAGVAFGKLGRWEEAVAELERASVDVPNDVEVLIDLANAQGQLALTAGPVGKFTGARKTKATLERAAALAPDNLEARYGLFGYYLNAPGIVGGSRDKALAELAAMERIDRELSVLARADLALADKNHAEALALYRRVQRERPEDFRGHYGFGRVAALSGIELDDGLTSLRRCLTLAAPLRTPRLPGVHLRIGDILQRRGDIVGARAAYQESLRIDPEYRFARHALTALDKR